MTPVFSGYKLMDSTKMRAVTQMKRTRKSTIENVWKLQE